MDLKVGLNDELDQQNCSNFQSCYFKVGKTRCFNKHSFGLNRLVHMILDLYIVLEVVTGLNDHNEWYFRCSKLAYFGLNRKYQVTSIHHRKKFKK